MSLRKGDKNSKKTPARGHTAVKEELSKFLHADIDCSRHLKSSKRIKTVLDLPEKSYLHLCK